MNIKPLPARKAILREESATVALFDIMVTVLSRHAPVCGAK